MKKLMKTLEVVIAVVFVTNACDQSALDDIKPGNRIENPDRDNNNDRNGSDSKKTVIQTICMQVYQ